MTDTLDRMEQQRLELGGLASAARPWVERFFDAELVGVMDRLRRVDTKDTAECTRLTTEYQVIDRMKRSVLADIDIANQIVQDRAVRLTNREEE